MKITIGLLFGAALGCMSDSACGSNECCYMYTCHSQQHDNCTTNRIDFYQYADKVDDRSVDGDLVELGQKWRTERPEVFEECDNKKRYCVDYIAEIVKSDIIQTELQGQQLYAQEPETSVPNKGMILGFGLGCVVFSHYLVTNTKKIKSLIWDDYKRID